MGLTSPATLWTAGAVAVLLPVVVAVTWSRLPGPRAAVVAQRVGSVVVCQLAALLVAGVAVNDYGYFYDSWGQVASATRQAVGGGSSYAVAPLRNTASDADAGSSAPTMTLVQGQLAGSTTGAEDVPVTPASQWPVDGRLEAVDLHGPDSDLTSQAYVYLPPQYFQKHFAHHRFPVTEILGGYPSEGPMLVKRLDFQGKLLAAIDHHTAKPMVLVMMRPTITAPRDTECTNVPGGPQVQTFYTQDVPSIIAGHFRVEPSGWAAAGISTGGYCSVKFALTDPTQFPVAASLSGYYRALQDDTTGNLWGGSPVVRDLNDPEWLLAHQPAPAVHLLLTSSRDEGGTYGITDLERFLGLVHAPLQVSTMIAPSGGHTFSTWNPEITPTLQWISRQLGGGSTTSHRPSRTVTAAGAVGARTSARDL